MKKTLVVLLILAVAGGVAFGEGSVSIRTMLGVDNITGAKVGRETGPVDWAGNPTWANVNGKAQAWLGFHFTGSAETELGPGALYGTVSLTPRLNFTSNRKGDIAGPGNSFWATNGGALYGDGGNNFVETGYKIGVGPGTLGFGLRIRPLDSIIRPIVNYNGLELGIVTLGFWAQYDMNFTGISGDSGKFAAFGRKGYTDVVMLGIGAEFEFGLGIWYEFGFYFSDVRPARPQEGYKWRAKSGINGHWAKVNYNINESMAVGSEFWVPGYIENDGVDVTPYFQYNLNETMNVGVALKLGAIGRKYAALTINPGVWFGITL